MAKTLVIDRDSGIPVHLQIRNHIKAKIKSGKLPEGSRLPPLIALCRQYGTAYATMHRVIRDLEHEGVVKGARGRGVFVCGAPDAAKRSGRELRMTSIGVFSADEATYLQNRLPQVCPGMQLTLGVREEDADIICIEGDDIPIHAAECADISDLLQEVFGRSSDSELFRPFKHESRSVMMPVDVNTFVMLLNVDMFESHGVPLPRKDWTWEECVTAIEQVNRPSDGRYGFFPLGSAALFPSIVWGMNGRVFTQDGERSLLSSDEGVAAGEILRRLSACSLPGGGRVPNVAEQEMVDAFAARRVAVSHHNRWFPEMLRRTSFDGRWTAYPIPRINNLVGVCYAMGYGLRKDTPAAGTAREFFRAAGEWEKWPTKVGHHYGFYLHSDLDRHDEVERVYWQMLSCSRMPLSDILPDRRTRRHRDALIVMQSALLKILFTGEPVARVMRDADETIHALLGTSAHGHYVTRMHL